MNSDNMLDIVPAPLALTTPPMLAFAESAEVQDARTVLEQLSKGATDAETASQRCRQTIMNVQRLLDPDSLTHFKFKRQRLGSRMSVSGTKEELRTPVLSTFAKMVFDTTNVHYRYLTPQSRLSRDPSPKQEYNGKLSDMETATGKPPANGYTVIPQHPRTPSYQQTTAQVLIPSTLTPAQRAEYQYAPESSQMNHIRDVQDQASSVLRQTTSFQGGRTDQRHKAEQAVHTLQSLLRDVFEAEDHMQLDTSGSTAADVSTFFTRQDIEGNSSLVLQPDVQAKLDSCIHKVSSHARLQDLDVEYLLRVQRMCEGPMSAVQMLKLRIADDWSEQDIEEWQTRLGLAESGLIAARTIMRISVGSSQQKELQSENFLRQTLEALRTAVEECLIPVVEEQPFLGAKVRGDKTAPPPNPKFQIAAASRQALLSLTTAISKDLRVLNDLLVKTDFDETSLSSIEYLCKTLIFTQNASTEKDAALGVQAFEGLRRCAMDLLAKIFTKYTGQRQFIFDEILISLERLPATKQSARQYRLPDAKPIQLVSALLLRLIQTSATQSAQSLKVRSSTPEADQDSEGDETQDDDAPEISPTKRQKHGRDLRSVVEPLQDAAQASSIYIVKVLIHRALTTSKSSDEPFRRLLDIFTDDFLNVLGSSDWPAAELLLRTFVSQMIHIVDGSKSSAPSKTLALEMLGTMGSGILELQKTARDLAKSNEITESQAASRLTEMISQLESGFLAAHEVAAADGPYRRIVQYLEARNASEEPQLGTARGYHLMAWSSLLLGDREASVGSEVGDTATSSLGLEGTLKEIYLHRKSSDDLFDTPTPSTAESRLAAMVITLNSKFCKAFNRILATLLREMTSEHSTVKSRSLKSVAILLETDPTILDDRNRPVLDSIFRCTADNSPLVRDSALSLVDKCLSLRPDLSTRAYRRVIERTVDAATGVRKRALRMLKDIYLRNEPQEIRSEIANAIVSRISDAEEAVSDLARLVVEDIWFLPFYDLRLDGESSIAAKLAYASQAGLLVKTIADSDEISKVLEVLIKRLLSLSKTSEPNTRVCRTLVAILFDGVSDNGSITGSPAQDQILRGLSVFARACPSLITASQLERLEPYTKNLAKSDDLEVYRSVITILRNVMPHLPVMNEDILRTLQTTLLTSVTRLQKPELREVAPCLWTIDGMLGNTERLVNFMISVLSKIFDMRGQDLASEEKKAATLARLMRIAGEFGNACNFESYLQTFRTKFDWYKEDSVAGLIVEVMCSFTSPEHPTGIRLASLDAICTVCQARPKQFLRSDVTNAFESVFKDRVPELEAVLIAGFEAFFVAQEIQEDASVGKEQTVDETTGTDRLGKTYVASDQDGASTALAQRFLSPVLRVALSSNSEAAFTAARLVISINKQGLVHPKESGPALVALETCRDKSIANQAFQEHMSQHQKHESLFEKEYMRAVQQAFEYQQRVDNDPTGFTGQPAVAKLQAAWEVLKLGKAQSRKKFLGNLAQKLDFDLTKANTASSMAAHLTFSRFCAENMALLEYDKVDDVMHVTSALDKVFAGTGTAVAQAIESQVLQLNVVAGASDDGIVMPNGSSTSKSPETKSVLQHLGLSAQVLCLVSETANVLRKIWNLQKYVAKTTQKGKEVNRTATRIPNAQALTDTYLARVAEIMQDISDDDAAHQVCSTFVEVFTVDNDVKVGSDDEGADADTSLLNGYETPSESSGKTPSLPPSGGGRGRKRKNISATPTSRKSKKARPSLEKRKSTGGKCAKDGEESEA